LKAACRVARGPRDAGFGRRQIEIFRFTPLIQFVAGSTFLKERRADVVNSFVRSD
jgi:hypothetical protein